MVFGLGSRTTKDDRDEDFSFTEFDDWMVRRGDGSEEGGGGAGDYTDWVGLVREVLRPRLDTVEDFLPDAIFKNKDERDLVVLYIELGKQQLNAPVNNRRAELARINRDIRTLNDIIAKKALPDLAELSEEGTLTDDFLELLHFVSVLRADDDLQDAIFQFDDEVEEDEPESKSNGDTEEDPAWLKEVHTLRDDLRDMARRIYWSMQRDKEMGQFQDYGELKEMFADISNGRKSVGGLVLKLPYFLSKAFTLCRATESNTRRAHAQATMARQLDTRGQPDALEEGNKRRKRR